ncbi:hypothetical protein [Xanthobacter sp. YC-JY1]|uniref:hypothetical protein n=1 Tax=Xanthobacter sp. YC-JY1 TaxID=2419844 RepID=UPI001F43ECB4|nr:hypothetical protein [Xanthobacter sp. YC-JY1]UJX46033.1 hypothetical protein D7006_15855 [Xanthobacter sp. YC-JY1]
MRTSVTRTAHRRTVLAALSALALVPALVVAPTAASAASERFMVLGLPFFKPYRAAIATLDVDGAGKVTGTLAPPAGDARAALPVSGTLASGALRLTIGQGDDSYALSFTENQRGLHHIYEETAAIPGLTAVTVFRPEGGFSEPALVLQHDEDNWCGLVTGGLTVDLKAAELGRTPVAPAGLAEIDLVVTPQQGGTAKVKMKDYWSRLRLAARDGDDVSVDVAVPLGTEAKIAQDLRKVPLVATVTLPSLCGEMALAAIPRAKVMEADKVSEAKLKAYGDTMLARVLSGAAPEGGTGTRKFKVAGAVVPGEAGPAYKATVSAESEASRLAKGNWDQFTVLLQPVVTPADTAASVSLVPLVTDLKVAKKAGPQAPADAAFKPADDSSQVAAISHRLVSYIAAAEGTRCSFLTQTAFDEPDGSLSCTNLALDDVSPADDN